MSTYRSLKWFVRLLSYLFNQRKEFELIDLLYNFTYSCYRVSFNFNKVIAFNGQRRRRLLLLLNCDCKVKPIKSVTETRIFRSIDRQKLNCNFISTSFSSSTSTFWRTFNCFRRHDGLDRLT